MLRGSNIQLHAIDLGTTSFFVGAHMCVVQLSISQLPEERKKKFLTVFPGWCQRNLISKEKENYYWRKCREPLKVKSAGLSFCKAGCWEKLWQAFMPHAEAEVTTWWCFRVNCAQPLLAEGWTILGYCQQCCTCHMTLSVDIGVTVHAGAWSGFWELWESSYWNCALIWLLNFEEHESLY